MLFKLYVLSLLATVGRGQAVLTLQSPASPTCGNTVTLRCIFTGLLAVNAARFWKKDSVNIVTGGVSTDPKYIEDTSQSSFNYFELTITSFVSSDDGDYACVNGFDTSADISIACAGRTTTTSATTTTTTTTTTTSTYDTTTSTNDTTTETESTISTNSPGKQKCIELTNGVYNIDCKSYATCTNGHFTEHQCSVGKVFNSNTKSCHEEKNVGPPCGLYRDCTQRPDGLYTYYELNCTSFFTCAHHIFFGHRLCAPGTVFEQTLHTCVWPTDAYPPCGTKQ